jgi:hypothetical protein
MEAFNSIKKHRPQAVFFYATSRKNGLPDADRFFVRFEQFSLN